MGANSDMIGSWCRLRLGYASAGELVKYQAEYEDACVLKKEWKSLQMDSMALDDSLSDTKDTFAELSTTQVWQQEHGLMLIRLHAPCMRPLMSILFNLWITLQHHHPACI